MATLSKPKKAIVLDVPVITIYNSSYYFSDIGLTEN